MTRFVKSKKVSDTGNNRKLGPDTVPEDRDTVVPKSQIFSFFPFPYLSRLEIS